MTQKPADEPADSHENQPEKFFNLSQQDINIILTLSGCESKVYLWLKLNSLGEDVAFSVDTAQLANYIGVSQRSIQRAIASLKDQGLFPSLCVKELVSVESIVRDRLQVSLGGLTEVVTAAGRIDVLTSAEIIEVKRVDNWKSALGQVLVYSGFYPNHIKRIHLFGSQKDIGKVADIESACLPFGVLVTFEVVAE